MLEPRPEAVVGVLIRDNRTLLISRKKDGEGFVGLPGGKVERGETLVQALARELREELGIEIDSETVRCVYGAPTDTHYTYVFFVFGWTGKPQAQEPGEHIELREDAFLVLTDAARSKYVDWYKKLFEHVQARAQPPSEVSP